MVHLHRPLVRPAAGSPGSAGSPPARPAPPACPAAGSPGLPNRRFSRICWPSQLPGCACRTGLVRLLALGADAIRSTTPVFAGDQLPLPSAPPPVTRVPRVPLLPVNGREDRTMPDSIDAPSASMPSVSDNSRRRGRRPASSACPPTTAAHRAIASPPAIAANSRSHAEPTAAPPSRRPKGPHVPPARETRPDGYATRLLSAPPPAAATRSSDHQVTWVGTQSTSAADPARPWRAESASPWPRSPWQSRLQDHGKSAAWKYLFPALEFVCPVNSPAVLDSYRAPPLGAAVGTGQPAPLSPPVAPTTTVTLVLVLVLAASTVLAPCADRTVSLRAGGGASRAHRRARSFPLPRPVSSAVLQWGAPMRLPPKTRRGQRRVLTIVKTRAVRAASPREPLPGSPVLVPTGRASTAARPGLPVPAHTGGLVMLSLPQYA